MIGVDTKVLVRYLVPDVEARAAAATEVVTFDKTAGRVAGMRVLRQR